MLLLICLFVCVTLWNFEGRDKMFGMQHFGGVVDDPSGASVARERGGIFVGVPHVHVVVVRPLETS